MRHFIEGSDRYYFNDETLRVEFCTITNKFKEREVNSVLGYNSYGVRFFRGNRLVKKQLPISYLILKYIKGHEFRDGDIIEYIDGNSLNDNINNLRIGTIYSKCKSWVDLKENSLGIYKLSSSGLLYNKEHYHILDFSHIKSGYLKKNNYSIHHLVWKYFGDKELKERCVIDHIDNNPFNNDISNLQMVSQNINIKKEKKKNVLNGSVMITYDNKTYYLGKSKFYTADKCESIYNNALRLCEEGIIDGYFVDHDYISYDFLQMGWKIIGLPNSARESTRWVSDLRFKSYNEAEEKFNELILTYQLKYYKRKTKEFYLDRGCINFGYNGKRYSFTLSRYDQGFSEKVIDYYLLHTSQEFLDMIPSFKREKEEIECREIKSKKKNKIKNVNLTNITQHVRSDYWIEFNKRPNYSYSNKDDKYIFNIPFDGHYYYVGPIQYQQVVEKVDKIISEKKDDNSINFLQWLKDFTQKEFLTYQEEDMKIMVSQKRYQSKGYYYFKPRDCWKAHIKHNGDKKLLGYYKNEECAAYIYKEAVLSIEMGVFEKWYLQIEKHRERVKWLFNE